VIIDSSALVALVRAEPDADRFKGEDFSRTDVGVG
jgi:uncharacterized protein with PIN domain